MTPEQFVKFIDAVDADLPKLKSLLTQFNGSPMLATIVTKFFPALSPVIPILNEVAPYLDFLQGLVDKLDAALHA